MATTTKKTTATKPAAKKTTTKAAAKKTVTAKSTAKKTATTKPAVKKTATTKTATKKTTTAKATTTTKSNEISVTGNKKISTLMKEFNKQFPYLNLCIFYSYARQQVAKGENITPIEYNKTLASVRRADSGGDISISGNKKIKTLEKEFDTVFGLYAQVCFAIKGGQRRYTTGAQDEITLAAFNKLCEDSGCIKGAWV